jgi:hypothetical protein
MRLLPVPPAYQAGRDSNAARYRPPTVNLPCSATWVCPSIANSCGTITNATQNNVFWLAAVLIGLLQEARN